MKFAMCNELFTQWSTEKQFQYIAECGYDGVELAPFTLGNDLVYADPPTTDIRQLTEESRNKIRSLAEQAGLKISGLHWLLAKTDQGFYTTSSEKEVRIKTARYFAELAHCCRDLGGSYLVLGSPGQRTTLPGMFLHEAFENALDVLERLLPSLEETGVYLGLEPLTTAETDFLLTGEDALFLIEKLGSPKHIGIHFDCKAMTGSEREPIADILRKPQYRNFLKTFHANDPNLRGPGFGRLEFGPILGALQEIQFDGWIGVEPFDTTIPAETLARESLFNLKKYL